MAAQQPYDYATEILDQPGAATAPGGYDYASEILDEPDTAQPGAMLSGPSPLEVPEFEQGEPEEMSFMEEIEEMWTGRRRRTEDWDEVPVNVQSPTGEVIPIQDQMSIARDNDIARAQIFQAQLPEADVEFDKNMNPYTTYFGEPRYLNRPGRSMGDLSEAITTLPVEFLAARTGGTAGKALGFTGQVLGAGGALFGTSLAQDKFARVWGSDQPLDWKRAQMMGMFGAGGEALGILLGKFFTQFFGSRRYVKKTGEFTKKGRKVLESQGINPDEVTDNFRQAFMSMIDDAVEPGAAVTMAEAETLPKKVPMTRGDVTRDVRQQALESRAEKGAMGQGPKEKMDEFRRTQRDALVENRDTIQAGIGQTEDLAPTVAGRGEGMYAAQGAMHATRRAIYENMKAAYREAGQIGMRVDVEGLRIVRDYIRDALKTFPDSGVNQEMMRLERVVNPQRGGPRIRNVNIREMEIFRQRLQRLTQSSTPHEAQAAREAIRALDEGLDIAIEAGAYSGSTDALKAYMRGRQARRLITKMFEEDQIVNKILETNYGPRSTLKRPPDEAANLIFAGDALGFKVGAENALKRIRTNLLATGNEQAWNAIREEAVWRLMISTESADIMSDGVRAFSGKKFSTLFDKTMRNHGRLMRTLFTDEEIGLLRQFRNVAVNATTKVKGAENFSNSAIEGARILEMVFGKGARLVQNAVKAFETARQFGEQTTTTKIMTESIDYGRGYRLPGRRLPPGAVGGVSAIGGEERRDTMSRTNRRRLER